MLERQISDQAIISNEFQSRAISFPRESVRPKSSVGFLALATALREALQGGSGPSEVRRHQEELRTALKAAKERLQSLAIPNQVLACVSPIVRNAEILTDKLTSVLELVDEYLIRESNAALQEALLLLDRVQRQVKVAY